MSGQLSAAYVRGLQGEHPRYIRANAGCKHFDVHGGPESIPVSRFGFDAKVIVTLVRRTALKKMYSLINFMFLLGVGERNRLANDVSASV
jgi:hypothetical protein